jgi:effector-binding domain-containing protein/Arc/MetJ-type ribon-helix-helix transcriptional regulator
MGIPIREIKAHLEKRAFESYDGLLRNHLEKVEEEIENLKGIRRQLKRRVEALDHVKDLPPIGRIHVQHLQARRVVMEEKRIQAQLDWEKALQRLVVENGLAHGVYVGDLGFLVDLKQVEDRAAEDFVGVYILTGFQGKEGATEESAFPAGDWLTLYVRGGHSQAKKHYKQLLAYAEDHGMVLGPYATERMLIDHYISHDENDHVTEIMIPMDLG